MFCFPGGMVDSPWYPSLVTSHLQLVTNQHLSKATALWSLLSDNFHRLYCKCGPMVSFRVPSLQVTFPVFLASLPRSPCAPHSEEWSELCAPHLFTTWCSCILTQGCVKPQHISTKIIWRDILQTFHEVMWGGILWIFKGWGCVLWQYHEKKSTK